MTLNEALLDLRLKGLPYPSAFSVFFLYTCVDNRFSQDRDFDYKFSELLALQKAIQKLPLV